MREIWVKVEDVGRSECVPQSGDGAGTGRDASLTGCRRKDTSSQGHPDRGEDRARFASNRVDTGHWTLQAATAGPSCLAGGVPRRMG